MVSSHGHTAVHPIRAYEKEGLLSQTDLSFNQIAKEEEKLVVRAVFP